MNGPNETTSHPEPARPAYWGPEDGPWHVAELVDPGGRRARRERRERLANEYDDSEYEGQSDSY